jgi:hypothetical protein
MGKTFRRNAKHKPKSHGKSFEKRKEKFEPYHRKWSPRDELPDDR